QPDGSFEIPSAQVQALRDFVDRYHVNALLTPHPSSAVKNSETQQETLRAWLAAFDRAAKELNRPQVIFYTYLKDEPNTLEDYRYVQKWGRAVREAHSVVKVLRSGKWYRGDGGHVAEFEAGYAKLLGAKRCLATASGTTALLVSLHVMDVDAGEEVIADVRT